MAPDPQTLTVLLGVVPPEVAAREYAPIVGLDPEGKATPESLAWAGPSFGIETEEGRATFTLSEAAGKCWIHAAVGAGRGMTEAGLRVIESIAVRAGCVSVGFQTQRRGLVRKARELGYVIAGQIGTGHVMEKKLQ